MTLIKNRGKPCMETSRIHDTEAIVVDLHGNDKYGNADNT